MTTTSIETRPDLAATLPLAATSGKTDSPSPAGVDIGNGSLKLVCSQGETRIDSYVHYLIDHASMATNFGYVEYQSGDRSDLLNKQWVGGLKSYYHGMRSIYRVTDTNEGKADLGLQILLSGLSMLPYRSDWKLLLVCSIHDGKALGTGLKQALEGTHTVLMQGKRSTVQISVAAVLEEGTGAIIHYQRDCDTTNALLYDLVLTNIFRTKKGDVK